MGQIEERINKLTQSRVRVYINKTRTKEAGRPVYSVVDNNTGKLALYTDNVRLANVTMNNGIFYGRMRGPLRADEYRVWEIIELFPEGKEYVDRNGCPIDESPFVSLRPEGVFVAVRRCK